MLLKQSLLAASDILQCAYEANKGQIHPHQIGSFHNVWPTRGVAARDGTYKFVPCRDMAVQTMEEKDASPPELMIEEFPDDGDFNAAGPSSHDPLDVAGPSHYNPYEAAGTSSANNRDPRFKQDTQQQRPFQTWSTKSSYVRNRGAINNGTSYSRGKRMEPYKAQPRAQPQPQQQPQPLPIGHFSDAKNTKRTEYEKKLLELLKQSQAKLRRFKRH